MIPNGDQQGVVVWKTTKLEPNKSRNTEDVAVEVVKNENEWLEVRKCIVRAFHNYPLYRYLFPDASTREEFLTRFIEANYDVAVRNGRSIVVSISIGNPDRHDNDKRSNDQRKIIGGVWFVPPGDKTGWDNAEDEVYFESYERHGMRELDWQAYENLIRYEAWESEFVLSKMEEMRKQTWLIYFWAIDPDYSNKGYGTASHDKCIQVLGKSNHERLCRTRKDDQMKNVSCQCGGTRVPVLMAIGHCPRAICFYTRKGFKVLETIPVKRGIAVCKDGDIIDSPPYARIMVRENDDCLSCGRLIPRPTDLG